MHETIPDQNRDLALEILTTADEADQRRTIREQRALIDRLRLIVSAQARLIGRLYAKVPVGEGVEL